MLKLEYYVFAAKIFGLDRILHLADSSARH
jgi:hypothetical protein